jgi:hypothetical protein
MAHRTTCYRCGAAITPPTNLGYTGRIATVVPKVAAPRLDRRQVQRHDVNLPGQVLSPNGEVFAEITVRNIGTGGLFFDSSHPFQLHDRLTLRIEMEKEWYVTEAVVKHCGQVLSNETPYSSGVEFERPDGAFLSCIARLDMSRRETWS